MADEEQVKFYDEFIDHFNEQKDNGRNVKFRSWIKKWIFEPKKVLDFGCALGYNSAFFTEVDCEVHGIDISPKCIEVAKERYPKCNWYSGDITDGFDPGIRGFDFILMSDVIEHVPRDKHEHLFHKLAEWSAKSGVIIASVPNSEHYEKAQTETYQPVEEKIEIPKLLQTLRAAGFSRIISVFLDGPLYYRMVIQKVSP